MPACAGETSGGARTATATLPNFLYVGPDKAGSTWLADVLDAHPHVHVAAAKDTYFFTDRYDHGLAWYARQFRGARGARVVAELCHDYLFSAAACRRIARHLPDVRLMVCLRKPSDRAFSAYLHAGKHGLYQGSFEQAIRDIDVLVDHGRYATHLRPYLDAFGRDRIYAGVFDDLQSDPQRFSDELFEWLEVEVLTLPPRLLRPRLAASAPRSRRLARWTKAGARQARAHGLARLVGAVKRSPVVQRTLYRPYAADRPQADDVTLRAVDRLLVDEVVAADRLLGLDLVNRWGLC
jgi:Sulfotransferase domain